MLKVLFAVALFLPVVGVWIWFPANLLFTIASGALALFFTALQMLYNWELVPEKLAIERILTFEGGLFFGGLPSALPLLTQYSQSERLLQVAIITLLLSVMFGILYYLIYGRYKEAPILKGLSSLTTLYCLYGVLFFIFNWIP
jgi:hypothetical protein